MLKLYRKWFETEFLSLTIWAISFDINACKILTLRLAITNPLSIGCIFWIGLAQVVYYAINSVEFHDYNAYSYNYQILTDNFLIKIFLFSLGICFIKIFQPPFDVKSLVSFDHIMTFKLKFKIDFLFKIIDLNIIHTLIITICLTEKIRNVPRD